MTIKKSVAILAAILLVLAVGSAVNRKPEGAEVVIIMYHSIDEESTSPWSITAQDFESDLQYLKDNGYETVTVRDLISYVNGDAALPEKAVVLTFDDGYDNSYTQALPLLEKYDACAVVSVIGTAMRDSSEASVSGDDNWMSWEQVAKLYNSGRVEIASHTWDMHSNTEGGRTGSMKMENESADEYRAAFAADNDDLICMLNDIGINTPLCFTYPLGAVCEEAQEGIKQLGYQASLTSAEGMNKIIKGNHESLYNLKRYNRSPDRPIDSILSSAKAGIPSRLAAWLHRLLERLVFQRSAG